MTKHISAISRKILSSFIAVSLLVGILTIPSAYNAYAVEGGVNLPEDNFSNDYVANNYDNVDFFPFYNQLNEKQKNAYKKIVEGIQKKEETIYFATQTDGNDLTNDEFGEVINAVYYEHPELYWFGSVDEPTVSYTNDSPGFYVRDEQGNYTYDEKGNKISHYIGACPLYNKYGDDLEASNETFNKMIDEILAGVEGMSDGQKVYYLHNEVCKRVAYDYDDLSTGTLDATVYGTLTNGKAVCQGYARTLQYLLETLGVPANIIFGHGATEIDSEGLLTGWEAHGWLIVKIDGAYYNVDATWDDCLDETNAENDYSYISYDNCLVNDNYQIEKLVVISSVEATLYQYGFSTSHVRDAEFEFLPDCTTVADFETLTGLTREEAFEENINRDEIDCKVSSKQDYVNIELQSVFSGSEGSVVFTKSGDSYVASGVKAEAGNRLVSTAVEGGIVGQIPFSYFKYILEATPKTFIVTSEKVFNNILYSQYWDPDADNEEGGKGDWVDDPDYYDRNEIINNIYKSNIGFKNSMYSIRTISYKELQNNCYVLTIIPDVFYVGKKTLDKKATVIDWSERQGTIEVEEGGSLDLSGKKINVYYNDYTYVQVDASELSVTGFDSSKTGGQDVTLTYTGENDMLVNTVTLHVEVVAKEDGSTYETGDVNGDGQLNSDDAIRVLMYTQFPNDQSYVPNQGCDFNGDGQVNSNDAIIVLMHTQFPADNTYTLVKNDVYLKKEN